MGYSLTCCALDWTQLGAALGGTYPDLAQAVLRAPQDDGGLDPARLSKALSSLLGGPLGRTLARRGPEPADGRIEDVAPDIAQAFVAIVQTLGQSVGALVHNSAAGERFRDVFLDASLPAAIGPIDGMLLIDRPLFGITHPGYPSWGGLRRADCAALLEAYAARGEMSLEDSDEDDWLQDLIVALYAVRDRKCDLVTIYA